MKASLPHEKICHNKEMENNEHLCVQQQEKTEKLDCTRKPIAFEQDMEQNGLSPKELMVIVPDAKQLCKD